jgi:LmbE family N-acetylglucosaminyl deacetylase
LEEESRAQPASGIDALNEVKRAIVVGAHADDLETMMGGTTWLLAQRGVEMFELICTQGDLGSHEEGQTREGLATIRRQEAREAGEILGLKEVVTLEEHDGELVPTLDLRATIASYYRAWQADTLFTFDPDWAGQIHPDHRAAGRAAVDALMPSRMPLYRPEQLSATKVAEVKRVFLFSPTNPTLFIDVSEVYEKKVAASLAHKSQFPEGDKALDWMRWLDEETAKRGGVQAKYAEQFGVLNLW